MDKNKKLKLGSLAVLLITLAFWAGGCYPAGETGGEAGGTSSIYMIVFLVLLFGVFYFLTIRPQRKRQKQHREMVESLHKGDRVMTAGGIYGTIESLSEDSVVLKIESGATIRIARASVIGQRES